MTGPSYLEKIVGEPLQTFVESPPEARGSKAREAVPDLHFFLDDGADFEAREAPPRTKDLARSLFKALSALAGGEDAGSPAAPAALRERIVTDALLRAECDRDQNVYLGRLFTRRLTNAVPDLIFQPASVAEAASALRWARAAGVPVTLRGAASTAMGGSVPCDGGLVLDLSRLDGVDIDAREGVCAIGAGARLRAVHKRLAEQGLALKVYPSNLGGTFAGWFATGGIGLNAFGHGRALDNVRSAEVLLPDGRHLRFHQDGRLDVVEAGNRRTLRAHEAVRWFREQALEPVALSDLAGSEGVLGPIVQVAVSVEKRPEIAAFLLSFETRDGALAAAEWIAGESGRYFPIPVNLKLLSGTHLHHAREVWRDEDSRAWRGSPSRLSTAEDLPWTRTLAPVETGARVAADRETAGGYVFVDFQGPYAGHAFAAALPRCPGDPVVLGPESVRMAEERFRPQQSKRLGPGLLAAEILMPAAEVARFLPRAERIARNAGNELDAEVYYLSDGSALVIGGYLTDHRRGSFAVDLMIAPALMDLAMRRHRGRPYVLGRWQAAWAARKLGGDGLRRLSRARGGLDPAGIVNRGVLLGMGLRGLLGRLVASGFAPGVRALRAVYSRTPLARAARALLRSSPGPAAGRGEPAEVGARYECSPPEATGSATAPGPPVAPTATARALHCVNCGECNSVCPIFHASKVRLPQALTHVGEALHAGEPLTRSASALLDLCMRCGNCQEVCQAGIPHLPLYESMQRASDAARPREVERHVLLLAALRASPRYRDGFLDLRGGGYQRRAPASLPGLARFLVLRAENDEGPAATCVHCAACVPVCPTNANREFGGLAGGADPRWITTLQERCIGCGTCVEVCPANLANGGRTLRVVEAPTLAWFAAVDEIEAGAAR